MSRSGEIPESRKFLMLTPEEHLFEPGEQRSIEDTEGTPAQRSQAEWSA